MSAMSCSREAATNALSVDLAPATKREFFHASKYSDIVGVITTSAVNASCVGRLPRRGGGVEVLRVGREVLRGGDEEVGVRHRLAELDLAVAVEVGLTPLAANCGSVPHSEVSSRKKKLPGCSNVLPAGVLIENGTAFSGSDLSAPASMITSKSASDGTPATTPSISS